MVRFGAARWTRSQALSMSISYDSAAELDAAAGLPMPGAAAATAGPGLDLGLSQMTILARASSVPRVRSTSLGLRVRVIFFWTVLPTTSSVWRMSWSSQVAFRSTGRSRAGRISRTPGPRATTVASFLSWPSSKIAASVVRIVMTDWTLPLSGPSLTSSSFSTWSRVVASPRK